MGILRLHTTLLNADGLETSNEGDLRPSVARNDANEQNCVHCGEPLWAQVALVGSRTLTFPCAHRCSI